MKYAYILVRLFAPLINLFTLFVNCFIWRDKRVMLFGAWMGDKFTDNPRFLFQYLNDHKEEYDIKKLVWVTRNENVYKKLKLEGYDVYMMHSFKSFYYHFRAGVHFICNIEFPKKGYAGDIMGQLSGHAIKINLFHGVGIKAGKSTGAINIQRGLTGKLRYVLRNSKLFCAVFTPGHWNRAYILSTSEECTKRDSIFCGVNEKWFIEAGYPRDCKAIKLFPDEQQVVERIRKARVSILYVPTFRDNGEVPHPLSEECLRKYIVTHGYLWIEKPHPASVKSVKVSGIDDKVLYLDNSFDISVVLPEIDILISDYSSVTYDAMAFNKPVLYYAPDYQHYLINERGFLCDYKKLVDGFEAVNVQELVHKLDLAINDAEFKQALKRKLNYERVFVLTYNKENIGDIVAAFRERLGIFQMI